MPGFDASAELAASNPHGTWVAVSVVVDNVRLDVPEPATLGLLAAGAMLLTRRR